MTVSPAPLDLIVIGGGLAGLTAGLRGLELGLRVLVLEKGEGEIYPCNSRHSGGVMHIGFLDPYRPAEDLVDVISSRTDGAHDPVLADALSHNGGRLLDWLKDKGTLFVRFNELEANRWCIAPPRALKAGLDWQGRGPDQMLRELVRRIEAGGGAVRRGVRARSLVQENGACVGVVVEQAGQVEEIRAGHVLIADGGFQTNKDLFRAHLGDAFERVFQRGARSGAGDGLTMAVEVGADLRGIDRLYGHLLCADARTNDNVWPYPELDAIATAGIVVNAEGRRIADEGLGGVHLTNQLAKTSAPEPFFVIFDAAIWDGPGQSARIPANPLLEAAGGTVHRADSLAEIATLAGIDAGALTDSVAAYNLALAQGTLDGLEVKRSSAIKPWPILKSPFLAIPTCPGITYTMGGIAIDAHAQVLDKADQPIPGLLAAGAATGGLEGGPQSAYIGGLMKAGVFGMLAAEKVADLKQKKTSSNPDQPAPVTSPPPLRQPRLARFPVLNAVQRFGKPSAIALALAVGAITLWLGLPALGMVAVPIAALLSLVVGILGLSYVELIRLIAETLMPD